MKFDSNGWLDAAIEYDYTNRSLSRNGYAIKYIVIHATAGGTDAEAIARGFRDGDRPASAQLIIDQKGKIAQGIPLSLASWGNGLISPNHKPFIPGGEQAPNPNWYTVAIEFVKASTDNTDALTPIQFKVGCEVINCICDTYNIPKRKGDANGGIIAHWDITATACPGLIPWQELFDYLKGGQKPMSQVAPSANQIKAAKDSWDSVLKSTVAGPAPTGSGIYNAWLHACIQGNFYGPPLTREYDSIDWGGNHIVVQEFARARCEWVAGAPNWYGPNGKLNA